MQATTTRGQQVVIMRPSNNSTCPSPVMVVTLIISFIISCLISLSSGQTYTIIAPSKLRPNADYHVSVSLHDIRSHVDVDVAILGQESDTGRFNTISKTVTMNSDDTRILKFEVGEWGPGSYRMVVIGKGDLDFRNESSITYEAKSYSVFIQTDKAIYKPGQVVKFRAVIVDPSLIPSVTGAIDIHVNVSTFLGQFV